MSKATATIAASALASAATVTLPNAAFVSKDSQPAMTARNNGDGTWSVTAGPGGTVLHEGLPMERALAIVGGQTGSYKPGDAQERENADLRVEAEQRLFDDAAKTQLQPDADVEGAEHLQNLPVATAPDATTTVADPAPGLSPAPVEGEGQNGG